MFRLLNKASNSISLAPKTLFSGTWTSGQKTITGATKYRIFVIKCVDYDDSLVGVWDGSGTLSAMCIATWANNNANNMSVFGVRFTTSGDNWTIDSGGRICVGTNYSYGFKGISKIIGIL